MKVYDAQRKRENMSTVDVKCDRPSSCRAFQVFSQFRLALWRPVLAVLHQNAPDRMLKVTNFRGGGLIPGARSARAWIRQFAMADLCDGGPEPGKSC